MAATVYTYQPNSAVDVKVRRLVGQDKVPTEVTTADARDVFSVRVDNAANTGAVTYLKFWNSNTVPTQDTTAPGMVLPAGAGVVANYSFLEGLLGGIWVDGIFMNATLTQASGNTSNAIQVDPSVLVNATVEHGV